MKFQRIRAIAVKEFRHILRDIRSLIMALALPMLMLLLFGWALTLDVDRIPTLVYDADGSPASRDLIAHFAGSRFFQIDGRVDSYAEIEKAIDRNRCLLAIVIPQNYGWQIARGENPQVQLLLDGSDSNTASIALGYANAILQIHSSEITAIHSNRSEPASAGQPVDGRVRIWYNSDLKSRNFIVPGLIALIMMIIAALLTSLTIAREWELGTMEQLLSTPARAMELVLGKMSAYFTLGVIDMILTVMVGVLVFRVPLRGNLIFLAFTGCVFLIGALFWGILLSAVTRTQLIAFQAGMLTSFLPAFLLSGFVFAIENMPPVIQVITYLFPTRYFVTILKGVFLRGVGLEVLWLETGLLLAFALVVLLVASKKVGTKIA